jgi:hypothetical protein
MATLDFFRNPTFIEKTFFDEGPPPPRQVIDENATRAGIKTITIDAYRQGVEITRIGHFDAGMLKIHAGEPGHIIRQTRFGMDHKPIIKEQWFQDNDKFEAKRFIQTQEQLSYIFDDIFTIPIVIDGDGEVEDRDYDGVLEPLTIRNVVNFTSIDAPYEIHSIKGGLMEGTEDLTLGSAQVLQIDYYNPKSKPAFFLDLVSRHEAYFSNYKTKVQAYDDSGAFAAPHVRPYFSGAWGSDMLAAVLPMTGSTDTYISTKQRSSTAGWDYDNNVSIGTDSIAFGGLTY